MAPRSQVAGTLGAGRRLVSNPGTLLIRPFAVADQSRVIRLWIECGLVKSWNNPGCDIERKLHVNPEWFLVGELGGDVVATCMAGYEGHRGWINYLAVSPAHRRQGIGSAMMAEAERLLRAAGCPKINLQVRESNREVVAFYRALGFSVDYVVSLGKRLVDDKPTGFDRRGDAVSSERSSRPRRSPGEGEP